MGRFDLIADPVGGLDRFERLDRFPLGGRDRVLVPRRAIITGSSTGCGAELEPRLIDRRRVIGAMEDFLRVAPINAKAL